MIIPYIPQKSHIKGITYVAENKYIYFIRFVKR